MTTGGEYYFGVEKSLTGRAWKLRPVDDALAARHAQNLSAPDLIGRILAGRNVPLEEGDSYLSPTLRSLFPDPSSFADMDAAAEAVLEALISGRKTAVFADYDVDGGTSAAQLSRYFRAWGRDLLLYVPDRLTEGYGPSAPAFERLKAQGVELVITVDCGAAAVSALEAAAGIGLDVVVLDHHLMQGAPPPAKAVVNPNRPDCTSGCGHLAAAGVVFVLLAAVNRLARGSAKTPDFGLPDPMQWLDLCALGTLCDMAPLHGVNRAFVTQGLKILSGLGNTGLAALAQVSGLEAPKSVYHATFMLGPKLNAGGRIGDPWLAAKLLSTDDRAEALRLAERLHALNDARKEMESEILAAATLQAEQRLSEKPDLGAIVVGGEGWHPGVIGIVAGRLKEKFHLPSVVIGWGEDFGDVAKGSGRSITGINLGELISQAAKEKVILSGGGHAMAAGLSLQADQFEGFRAFLEEKSHGAEDARREARVLELDGALAPSVASGDVLSVIDRAGPYGAGAPEPVFVSPNVQAGNVRLVGQNHLAFEVAGDDGGRLRAISFRSADTELGEAIQSGEIIHVAGRLKADEWRGKGHVQLEVVDAAFGDK